MAADSMLDSLGPLARALHDRGFELLVAVHVAPPIERMTGVVNEVRALTGMHLNAAMKAVAQQQMILQAVALEQAERASERLAAAGGNSSLSLARAHLYACLPEDPRRGAQTCERLTVIGRTLELAQGQLGAWGIAATQELPVDHGDLIAAIDRQRARWAAAGWHVCGTEVGMLHRVSARNEELEARIRAAEGEVLVHEAAVYGDWLQAQGDARGQIASAALSLDAAPEAERFRRAHALGQLVREHAGHVLGPAWPLHSRSVLKVEWMGPMMSSVKLAGTISRDLVELLSPFEGLLELPVCAGLRTLELQPHVTHFDLGTILARSNCASSLRRLSVSDAPRLTFENARFERLEQLEFAGDELWCTSLSVPALRQLTLEFPEPSGLLAARLSGLDAPSLEHFELSARPYEYWDHHYGPMQQQLDAMLEQPAFTRLRSLTLRSPPGSLPYGSGLATIFEHAPAIETLERIDLRKAALTPEARGELEAMRASLPELLLSSDL